MSAEKGLRVFSPVVVFIDDGFSPVSLDLIDADDWGDLRDPALTGWAEIREQHSISVEKPIDLKRNEGELEKAWGLYQQDPESLSILDPIFKKLLGAKKTAILPLEEIIHLFKEEFELTVCCHPDIESARSDIKRSKLVFLDFYLYQQRTADEVIEGVSTFSSLFSEKVDVSGYQHNRLLFLISTNLPSAPDIEKFRRAAKVKAAFFKPLPKDRLNKKWVQDILEKRIGRYKDLHHLATFLDTFSEQMEGVMEKIRTDFESLELHDLAILDHMRLKVDQEELGNYMSWLISEALAARIRDSAPMLKASEDVNAVHKPPFQGMLSTNQVLFSWFSDITFGTPGGKGEKIQFGDVFFENQKRETVNFVESFSSTSTTNGTGGMKTVVQPFFSRRYRHGPITRRRLKNVRFHRSTDVSSATDLVLVIAPACDLQRDNENYEVLCVRGKISQKAPSLVDLIQHSTAFGKDDSLGHFKHLLRLSDGEETSFLLVEWHPKEIITICASELKLYKRIARLNELFCQEIKEDALRCVGRVGVPVDPAFNIPLGATIVYTPKRKDTIHIEVPDSEIISGVFTSGNFQNTPRIILAEEFIERFCDEATRIKQAAEDDPSLEDICAKFEEARSHFLTSGGEGFEIKKKNKNTLPGGKVTIYYVSEFVRESGDKGFFGVYFYPRGAVKDPPNDNTSILDGD